MANASSGVTFARRVFMIAGLYGIVILTPQYFMESVIGRDNPPPITHPEHFYGFIGVALAWQVVFLIVARDPVRYRLLMIPSVLEKAAFGVAAVALYLQDRLAAAVLGAGVVDLVLGVLFVMAFRRTAGTEASPLGTPPAGA